jgi:signal transduction histidine kinase
VWRRLLPKTITGQITALVAAAILTGVALTFVILSALIVNSKGGMNPRLKAASEAARIATIVQDARASRSFDELAGIIARAQSPGSGLEVLPASAVSTQPNRRLDGDEFTRKVIDDLKSDWNIDALLNNERSGWTDRIVIGIDSPQVLSIQVSEYQIAQRFLLLQVGVVLSIALIAMLAVSTYAIRSVTRPLFFVAEAARSFGRSEAGDHVLRLTGPWEITQLAEALNEMRTRVRNLIDARTRMLAAISHDLRTPLTRLRLRAERGSAVFDRSGMLDDISAIDAMMSETLAYLRDGRSSEDAALIDIPSLLQTICDEFCDVGRAVQYRGPDRLAVVCRARALRRALTNVVENGVKHGSQVAVALSNSAPGCVQIDISDNGPGLSSDLLEKVFEPFFMSDSARTSWPQRGGFGLGLSIAREIIENEGGSIRLLNRTTGGLTACVRLERSAAVYAALDMTARGHIS